MEDQGYTPSWFQIENENYFYKFSKFKREYPNKTERHFVEKKIKELEKSIQTLNDKDPNNRWLRFRLDYYKLKLDTLTTDEKPIFTPLVHGKKLNLSERFVIADKVFNIKNIINSFQETSAANKHKLLAILLGCNEQTARNLYNGSHQKRTSVREEIVTSYLKSLK